MAEQKVFGLTRDGIRRTAETNRRVLDRLPTTDRRTRRVNWGEGGGAQIVQFTIDSVDCTAGTATGTVTDVLCSGADAVIGDTIDLVDPLGYLVGNPALLINHTGMAVQMSQDGPYGAACVYKIISMDDLGYSC